MQRRDAIVVAVLVNAGLLAVLIGLAVTEPATDNQVAFTPDPMVIQSVPAPVAGPIVLPPAPVSERPLAPTISSAPEVVEPVASPEPAIEMRQYVVQKGDALEKIARRHGVSVAALVRANNLKSSAKISVGQTLKVPVAGEEVSVKETARVSMDAAKGSSQQVAAKHYTVAKGDNLWAIAARHNLKTEELMQLNGLTADTARKLRPGDKLRVE